MKTQILATVVVGLMIFVSIASYGSYLTKAQILDEKQILNIECEEETILQEITETENKILVADKIIGDRYVKYWQHYIDDVLIKHDFILLHTDIENGEILEYERNWTDIKIIFPDFRNDEFKLNNYFWKRKIVFPDKEDCDSFYSFDNPFEYPVFCWEVRYIDGTNILYNLNGEKIGRAVSAPATVGLTLHGYGEPDWAQWMHNAYGWYSKWCDRVNSMGNPDNSMISKFLKEPDCSYFYVIAHSGGRSDRFQSSGSGVYYTASQLHEDMEDRNPYKLAVLCCCQAMKHTGPGNLSYEFRKGEMTDTVTIGYVNMGNCSGWPEDVFDWQDFMFKKIDRGYKMRKAFDLACARYPLVADYVKFVGDEDLRVKNNPPETYIYAYGKYGNYIGPYTLFNPPTPNRHDLELWGEVGKTYTFKATHPIIHPLWPDTNDPQDGAIAAYHWERTGSGEYNKNNDETTASSSSTLIENKHVVQLQKQVNILLEKGYMEGAEIEPIKWSWDEKGTYEVNLSIEDDDGAISYAKVFMHITSGDNADQNENQNSQIIQRSTKPLFFRILEKLLGLT